MFNAGKRKNPARNSLLGSISPPPGLLSLLIWLLSIIFKPFLGAFSRPETGQQGLRGLFKATPQASLPKPLFFDYLFSFI